MSRFLSLTIALFALLVTPDTVPAASAHATASQILQETGVSGGLIVHVHCGDGQLTAALNAGDGYLVQGLDTDSHRTETGRATLQKQGQYGTVSLLHFDGKQLPYIDNLVNLVVSEDLKQVAMDEVLRVLRPNGVAYIKRDGNWTKTVKPRPANIDEWTHYLHDSTNNAVAQDDVVAPPRHYQWVGSPRYGRHHDHMSSVSAVVTSGERLFTIFDEAPRASIEIPSEWSLIARDAFNGTILWKRPVPRWHTRFWPLKSGPAQMPRRLVAIDDTVYVTLALDAPVSALDAATGETIRTYQGTRTTEEIVYSNGALFLLVDPNQENPGGWDPNKTKIGDIKSQARAKPYDEHPRKLMAVDADSGNMLWESTSGVLPLTLTVDDKRVVYHDGESIVCLNRKNGDRQWASEPVKRRKFLRSFFAPTLVLHDDVVLFSGGSVETKKSKSRDADTGGGENQMAALSAIDGKILWTAEHPPSGYKSPEDILVAGGLVWCGATVSGGVSGVMIGRDPQTGEVKKEFLPDVNTYWFHHRCHRGKATENYLLMSRTGIEFIDYRKETWDINHWVRGACLYGIMPANGLIYAPQHPCACYLESKLHGFSALAPTRSDAPKTEPAPRLQKGPAYNSEAHSSKLIAHGSDWPTYRRDAARSGHTPATVPANLASAWTSELGGRLSAPVVANGKLFVAQVDAHTVHALDAASGKPAWSYTVGARVDSPPTIYRDRVLFGSADGYVYCLTAKDGQLAWRFRAAPEDRQMVSFEQIESVWPVHGSVLIEDDTLYCVAGRSMFVDGGLHFLRLDPATGKLLGEVVLDEQNPETGENLQDTVDWLNMAVALPDILSSDGRYVYMRSLPFDKQGNRQRIDYEDLSQVEGGDDAHLFCPTGFLDDAYWHRSYWVYGRGFVSGWSAYYLAGQRMPAGRVLVFDDDNVYGFGREPQYYRWTTPIEFRLFASDKRPKIVPLSSGPARKPGAKKKPQATRFETHWAESLPQQARAMVLADRTLFVAGVPDNLDEDKAQATIGLPDTQKQLAEFAAALHGRRGALLHAVSADTGKRLAEYQLDALPVFDGMAAAGGKLFIVDKAGKVTCFSGK
jgi:outer membrane protein assembly factor BamB